MSILFSSFSSAQTIPSQKQPSRLFRFLSQNDPPTPSNTHLNAAKCQGEQTHLLTYRRHICLSLNFFITFIKLHISFSGYLPDLDTWQIPSAQPEKYTWCPEAVEVIEISDDNDDHSDPNHYEFDDITENVIQPETIDEHKAH